MTKLTTYACKNCARHIHFKNEPVNGLLPQQKCLKCGHNEWIVIKIDGVAVTPETVEPMDELASLLAELRRFAGHLPFCMVSASAETCTCGFQDLCKRVGNSLEIHAPSV